MSTVKTDQVLERTADAGVTIDGVLIKDDVIKIPGGSPGAGKLLQSDADGNATWVAGGLTHASQWRLTTGFQGDASPIASNLEEVDAPVGFGVLGSSMTESSGIFTFPTTGYWLITFHASFACDGDNQWLMAFIYTTTNDSTYAKAAEGNCPSFGASTATNYPSTDASYIFDVTDTSTHKCAFYIDVQTATDDTEGNSDRNKTYMTFLRLADT